MFPLKLPYISTITCVILSLAFAIATDGNQTVTASSDKQFNEKEIWKREFLAQIQQHKRKSHRSWVVAKTQHRTALVIGNGAYQEEPLSNPVNDATDISKALEELDFEVILLKNKDLREMEDAIEVFNRNLRLGGVGVFYYAGHGVQVNGENYLVPLKAQLNREKDVRYEAVPLGMVLNAMEEAQTQVNIVIIDACRDNPFYRRWRSPGLFRGLAPVQSARGTLIAFATAPGEFAEDGEGKNSPFTSHLLKHIKTPGLAVELMFKRVRTAVEQETKGGQTPWNQTSLTGDFFSFNPTEEQLTSKPAPEYIKDRQYRRGVNEVEKLFSNIKAERSQALNYLTQIQWSDINNELNNELIKFAINYATLSIGNDQGVINTLSVFRSIGSNPKSQRLLFTHKDELKNLLDEADKSLNWKVKDFSQQVRDLIP